MIVIKLNKIPTGGQSSIKARAERAWKRKLAKVSSETEAIVVHKGCILDEYLILGVAPDKQETNRVMFDLSIKPNSTLKGKMINYPTRNPCTTTKQLHVI